jgi:16S rRNA (cytosine1402-N4)-methyltransferase
MVGHVPVMLSEVLDVFQCIEGEALLAPMRFLDATFGGGGHTSALLDHFQLAHVEALDCDPAAVSRAQEVSLSYGDRFSFRSMNFEGLRHLSDVHYSGVLFDFGVSSFQLDTPERGFSFRYDAPLDMRMNPNEGMSAAMFLETANYGELAMAIRGYGEEPRWRVICQAIQNARGSGRLQTTRGLADLVIEAVGERWAQTARMHPATRTFQGIRIAVNQELTAIEQALPEAFSRLLPGGVMAVISFHSLEDRIVKRFFRRMAGIAEHKGDAVPSQMRLVQARLLNRKPLVAEESETQENPRSRSARLRALIKEGR